MWSPLQLSLNSVLNLQGNPNVEHNLFAVTLYLWPTHSVYLESNRVLRGTLFRVYIFRSGFEFKKLLGEVLVMNSLLLVVNNIAVISSSIEEKGVTHSWLGLKHVLRWLNLINLIVHMEWYYDENLWFLRRWNRIESCRWINSKLKFSRIWWTWDFGSRNFRSENFENWHNLFHRLSEKSNFEEPWENICYKIQSVKN